MVAVAVVRIIRMMPVEQRVVETDLQTRLAESVHIFADQIPAAWRVGGLIVRQLAVKKTETVMMLRGQYSVFHAGILCDPGPFLRVIIHWVEFLEERLIVLNGYPLCAADPFAAGGDGVQAPVNEHTETVLAEPFRSGGTVDDILIHNVNLLMLM